MGRHIPTQHGFKPGMGYGKIIKDENGIGVTRPKPTPLLSLDGVVYMGSGDVSYITGVSLIRLRNHDGSTRVLTNVQYVPKLRKNLISLGP